MSCGIVNNLPDPVANNGKKYKKLMEKIKMKFFLIKI